MRGKRITIYIGESDQWQHRPLYMAILEHLKRAGCAGATVTRGLAGFGEQSRIKTANILYGAARGRPGPARHRGDCR